MRREIEGVGERKRRLLSLEKEEIEEKERENGSNLEVRDLRSDSSLEGSRRKGVEKSVMCGRDPISINSVLIWRRARTFQAFRTWFSSAGSM